MGSEKPKADDAGDISDDAAIEGLLKAAWDRRKSQPTPPSLTDHVERLIAQDPGEAEG